MCVLFNIKHAEFYRLTEIKINDKEKPFMSLKMRTAWISEVYVLIHDFIKFFLGPGSAKLHFLDSKCLSSLAEVS